MKRTNVDEGSMPKWNEVLWFPLEADNKEAFTKEDLMSSQCWTVNKFGKRKIGSLVPLQFLS